MLGPPSGGEVSLDGSSPAPRPEANFQGQRGLVFHRVLTSEKSALHKPGFQKFGSTAEVRGGTVRREVSDAADGALRVAPVFSV